MGVIPILGKTNKEYQMFSANNESLQELDRMLHQLKNDIDKVYNQILELMPEGNIGRVYHGADGTIFLIRRVFAKYTTWVLTDRESLHNQNVKWDTFTDPVQLCHFTYLWNQYNGLKQLHTDLTNIIEAIGLEWYPYSLNEVGSHTHIYANHIVIFQWEHSDMGPKFHMQIQPNKVVDCR